MDKYRPVLMIEPGSMSKKDVRRVERLGGIVIVECSKPDATRFADPPSHLGMEPQARAAMALLRWILTKSTAYSIPPGDAIKFWVECLVRGEQPPSVEPVKKAKP